MNSFISAFRIFAFMTLILGFGYPMMVTLISQVIFPNQANGQLIKNGDQVVGSKLIGQAFQDQKYFWPRPSAIEYQPLPSGGSNLSPVSGKLKAAVEERRAKLKNAHPAQTVEPPQDLLTASASGLDPHISPEAARYQLERVASARKLDSNTVAALIEESTSSVQLGFLGQRTVNVFTLNLALDREQD